MIIKQLLDKNYKISLFIGITIIWSVLILVLTTIPPSAIPSVAFRHIDKVVHFGLFLIFGFFLAGVVKVKWKSNIFRNWILVTIVLATGYGIAVEILQNYVPGRTSDLIDVFFNFIGALSGVYLFRFLKIILT